MLYEQYHDNRVYSGQQNFSLPKRVGADGRMGFGNEIILVTPTRESSIEVMKDPKFNWTINAYKRFTTDSTFKAQIGTKRIRALERGKTDAYYLRKRDIPLRYTSFTTRAPMLKRKINMVNDISRWMDLSFARIDRLTVKRKCEEFLRILKGRINDPQFDEYQKLLLIDMNSWTDRMKDCIIMNRRVLTNPLSILIYTACYFPGLLENFPDIRIMIVNRRAGQIYFVQSSFITRKNYPKIKSKLSQFKDVVFSVEDDFVTPDDDSNVDREVKAEVIASFKEDVKTALRYNLLGSNSPDNPFDDLPQDITGDVADPFDEFENEFAKAEQDEAQAIEEEKSNQETPDDQVGDINLTDEINDAVDDAFENMSDEEIENVDTDKLIADLSRQIQTRKYKASFMPERNSKEIAKIERLTKIQQTALPLPTLESSKRKALTTRTTGGYIKTSNPTITNSKFADFDKEYADKSLTKNIDDAVSILSTASDKIFVTEKTVEDSSDPMSLKELWTYHLEDERGMKMTVAFDVPKIIDGSYVYLNGSKKLIRHQLILKPIVKTGSDVVQIVTSYNKVFIYRRGVENQNSNKLRVYLEKNAQKFAVRTGNSSMLNGHYETPLDFAMLSKFFSMFTVGDQVFYMSIDALKAAYQKSHGKPLQYDEAREIPIALNKKTKEPLLLDLNDSYIEKVLSYFSPAELKDISSIKRKPKSVMACAKMMKREVPLVLFMMFCEGFASVMKKADINYRFIDKKERRKYDAMLWDFIELADGLVAWEKNPSKNELLMNGFKKCDLTDFTFEDLESKETYISLILPFYPGNGKIHYAFDNYRDFLLDEKSKEILTDFGYPTDLVSLLVVAAGMLADTKYMIENNLNNMRVRSTEVISDLVYLTLTRAYADYRATLQNRRPKKISVKRSIIIDRLLDADTNMIEEASVLNPVFEIEKKRSVTFKGLRGIQMNRAMTLPRRGYDRSMIGTLALNSSPDANVGVVRTLTLEPQITSTYGYIDTSKSEGDLKDLNAEPLQVRHDDPDRTSMARKHSSFAVPIAEADPVLMGNKIEAALPYYTTDEFTVPAKSDGKVVDIKNNYVVVQYNDGTYYSIDTSDRVERNGQGGFWIENKLRCDLKVGQKFKEGDFR